MARELPPYPPRYTVKPRKPSTSFRPIIALTSASMFLERDGSTHPASALAAAIVAEPSSIIVCQGFGSHLDALRERFGGNPTFQYRLTPRERYPHPANTRSSTVLHDTVCNFVGFDSSGGGRANYHYPLDPVHFIRQSIDELKPDINTDRLVKLCQWAQEVREWCNEQAIQVKPSSGGLVAQLLRDPRFYPEARRKCPGLINNICRTRLPGNYYLLRAEIRKPYDAVYLDQTAAHHAAALQIRFPNANTLHGFGRLFDSPEKPRSTPRRTRIIARPDSDLLCGAGLFRLRVRLPRLPHHFFPPPWLRGAAGIRDVWAYSNELELIDGSGAELVGVLGAVVSFDTDPGLNRYARFALKTLAANPAYRSWLKPTLHSTYGVLAARPTPFETGFYKSSGEAAEYVMGPASLPVFTHSTGKPVESRVANVIHRGMIEAQVRLESLRFARQLAEAGRMVLAVYADSVFIQDDGRPVELLPPPWRISEFCSGLEFYSATHFASRQLTRLPGMSRDLSDEKRLDRLIKRDILVSSLRKQTKSPKEGSSATSQDQLTPHPRVTGARYSRRQRRGGFRG